MKIPIGPNHTDNHIDPLLSVMVTNTSHRCKEVNINLRFRIYRMRSRMLLEQGLNKQQQCLSVPTLSVKESRNITSTMLTFRCCVKGEWGRWKHGKPSWSHHSYRNVTATVPVCHAFQPLTSNFYLVETRKISSLRLNLDFVGRVWTRILYTVYP